MAQNNMTAVEWIEEKMKKLTSPGYQTEISAMLKKAKEMEKDQIKEAYLQGDSDAADNPRRSAEQYYNETFGK